MTRRDVIIPAGGTINAAYAQAIGSPHRALAPFGPARVPVLQIVVDALRGSGCAGQIVCLAPPDVAARIRDVDQWLPASDRGPDNILRGLAALPSPDAPAWVCASDLPLLTSDTVAGFAERCDDECAVSVGLVSEGRYNAAYPGAPPSQFVPLRDAGPVTISGLFGVRPSALLAHAGRLARVFEARKSQARMARLLGPRLLWQWATGTLTAQAIAARTERLLHCRVEALADVAPSLACDMDTADDYTYAHQLYTARLVS